MTITYLDDKQGMQDAATTVPALEGTMVNPMQMCNPAVPVYQNDQPVKSKRGRPKGSRNKATRAKSRAMRGTRKGPGRAAKTKNKGRRIRSITVSKTKTRKKKTMTTETIQSTQNETRRGRKSEGKTCKLVCLITGSTRTAGSGYLSTKPTEFRSNYISRPALKLLRQGLSVQQVRQQLQQGLNLNEISPEALQNAIALNGKHKK